MPIRSPTPANELYAWHTRALAWWTRNGDLREMPGGPTLEEVHCGWYKRRLVRGGPWVPAAVWLHQEIDPETGELLGPEVLRCEVAGQECDPDDAWSYIAGAPISEQLYKLMHADSAWAKKWAPNDPIANPRERIDPGKMPLPF